MCRIREKTFNISDLRSTLGVFPTGVAVVTAAPAGQRPVGMTINSFQSISLQPPLVGWCIDGGAASFQAFARSSHFSISVLAASQAPIARRFATRGADKFAGVPLDGSREPLIPDAAAWLRCVLYRQIPLGDHLMLVGQVEELGSVGGDTLVFAAGRFGTAGSGADVVRAA